MPKPKILCVTPRFVPDIGGVENYAFNIMKVLVANFGWDVVVVTGSRTAKRICVEQKDGLKIYRLPVLFTLSNTPIHPLWPVWIRRIISTEKPDIINAHSPLPYMSDVTALVAGRVPFVLTYHSGSMIKRRFLPDVLISAYERFILPFMRHKAHTIILSSQFVGRTIMRAAQHKSVVIHPATDPNAFRPIPDHRYDTCSVLFVARFANMYRMKGLYNLIEAVKSLPNTKLRVVGEPLTMQDAQITFVGIKSGQDLIDELNSSTMLALPSLANAESFPLVLIEAMGCALPVVGTESGGIPEIIDNGINGYLVPAENSAALAKAIDCVVSNPKHAEQLGQAGRQKVETVFSWQRQAKQTDSLLRSILKI